MQHLRILISKPDASVYAGDGYTRVISSPDRGDRQAASRSTSGAALDASSARPADGTTVEVQVTAEGVYSVRAYRAIATSDELFWVATDGGLVIADHFRNALSAVPQRDRTIPEESIADHLLFRTTPGNQTYISGINRLGHGDELYWSSDTGEVRTTHCTRLSKTGDVESMTEAIRLADGALQTALQPVTGGSGQVNMLSGGVDSTLIHTYLGRDVPSVSAAIDSVEFAPEVLYARAASELVGTQHHLVEFREPEYLTRLESCIDALALPPHHLQTVLLDAAFESDYQTYITGQFADALFGLGLGAHGARVWRLRRLASFPGGLVSLAGGTAARKLGTLVKSVEQLRRPAEDPSGYGMQFATYTDWLPVREILGERLIESRLRARLEYVRRCVELPDSSEGGVLPHLEVGHWIDFYTDDAVSLWRQLAQARGKSLWAPFTSCGVVTSALEISPEIRYVFRGKAKPVLKRLLQQRLPAYPIGKRKLATGLPLGRLLRQGPLKDVFSQYGFPDFAESAQHRITAGEFDMLAWNLATFAIWRDRVVNTPVLNAVAGTRVFQWAFSRA